MYLYIPIDGRSVVVEDYTISGTGMQFSEKVPCLDKLVGIMLVLETETPVVEKPIVEAPIEEPEVEAEMA